jgi:hypothetical protein
LCPHADVPRRADAPPVVGGTAQGSTLIGVGFDYLDGRPLTSIFYKRRAPIINLFLAEGQHADLEFGAERRDGHA